MAQNVPALWQGLVQFDCLRAPSQAPAWHRALQLSPERRVPQNQPCKPIPAFIRVLHYCQQGLDSTPCQRPSPRGLGPQDVFTLFPRNPWSTFVLPFP